MLNYCRLCSQLTVVEVNLFSTPHVRVQLDDKITEGYRPEHLGTHSSGDPTEEA